MSESAQVASRTKMKKKQDLHKGLERVLELLLERVGLQHVDDTEVEDDTCMSYEEEDTCMSYEEEDACMSYEEENTCM